MSTNVFFSLIHNLNLVDLYKFLQTSGIDPTKPRDNNGSTALHVATLLNSSSTVKFFIRYIQDQYTGKEEKKLKDWVNSTNSEGYTCLMNAVHVGNKVIYM